MNSIEVNPRVIYDKIEHEGIEFSRCTFIDVHIDGLRLETGDTFDGVAYWPELRKSIEGSGSYLLFTCYCGIAQDSGWEPITVQHENSSVVWFFERNGSRRYVFSKSDYLSAIRRCEEALDLDRYPLAVATAIWPV